MTEQQRRTVFRRFGEIALVAVLVYVGVELVWAQFATNRATDEKAVAQQQAQSLADQVAEACARGGSTALELGAACQKAAEVQQTPVPQPEPVGIERIDAGPCMLTIRLTDGRSTVLSDLCGKPGRDAAPARSIVSTQQDGCTLTVAFSDGTSSRHGPFCGADGRSPPCLDEPAQCRGTDGESPPCLSEPNECRGVDGKPGIEGQRGPEGPEGPPGPACPDGYEQREVLLIPAGGGLPQPGVGCVRAEEG